MTALIDDLGVWIQLGTLQNSFDWQIFPVASSTGNTTYRINFNCPSNNWYKIKSICYLRAVYQQQGSKVVDQKWIRIYPKQEKEIVEIPLTVVLQKQLLLRQIEIISKLKYRRIGQRIIDEPHSITLEEFLPFPETINAVNNIPQLQGLINQELEELKGELNLEITANINNAIAQQLTDIQTQYNVIITMLSGGI